jgi:biopolymer transport protein ExbD
VSAPARLGAPAFVGVNLRRRRAQAKRRVNASLMLTPMVDMFSLLVIFLLQFFSSAPEFSPPDGLVLPMSASTTEPRELPVVSVRDGGLEVEHKTLGTIAAVEAQPEALAAALEDVRKTWAAKHPGDAPLTEINLEAHEGLGSDVVAKVMALLSAQHFGAIQLVAVGD